MIRSPAVAGHFYKANPEDLKKQVEGFIISGAIKRKAIGIVVPHAGLIYSGAVAGAVYSSIELPDTLVLIGPNHTGLGAGVSDGQRQLGNAARHCGNRRRFGSFHSFAIPTHS